jgi:L-ascorbate metabolism protein UlaG (beta-lactamase superfamily)
VPGVETAPHGSVTVRWSGTATLVFSDDETTWMTDGWFSRPGPFALAFGKIAPDVRAIERGLASNELVGDHSLAVVFPLHSHYDHAMDAPEVARRTGAMLVGSESTANIGYGWKDLDPRRIRVVRDRERLQVGKFAITPIASRHFEFPNERTRESGLGDPDIRAPVVPPVRQSAYKVGVAWVLHVVHPNGSWLVVGSAGYLPGALAGVHADTVFLGVGGLGAQSEAYREAYWHETIDAVRPSRIIPIHWDSLTASTEDELHGPTGAERLVLGGAESTWKFLAKKAKDHPEIRFETLPRYERVVLP